MFKNTEEMPVVFTAQSKKFFYCRDVICEWVLSKGRLPLNPFRVFDYFLSDRVDRDVVRRGNNNLIRLADELWVFGIVADGVLFEIEYAMELAKPVRFFTIGTRAAEIVEITDRSAVRFEPEIHSPGRSRAELLAAVHALPCFTQLDLFRPPAAVAARSDEQAGSESNPKPPTPARLNGTSDAGHGREGQRGSRRRAAGGKKRTRGPLNDEAG